MTEQGAGNVDGNEGRGHKTSGGLAGSGGGPRKGFLSWEDKERQRGAGQKPGSREASSEVIIIIQERSDEHLN